MNEIRNLLELSKTVFYYNFFKLKPFSISFYYIRDHS